MENLENLTYEEIEVGDSATFSKTLTERELVLFAAVSGDVNPVHLDKEFASQSLFGERIAHGMWSGSLISAALATVLPGPGTIYLGQNLSFKKPVKLQDTLTVTLEVTEKKAKNRVLIDCTVRNQDGETITDGQATVLAPSEKMSVEAPKLPEINIEGESC